MSACTLSGQQKVEAARGHELWDCHLQVSRILYRIEIIKYRNIHMLTIYILLIIVITIIFIYMHIDIYIYIHVFERGHIEKNRVHTSSSVFSWMENIG